MMSQSLLIIHPLQKKKKKTLQFSVAVYCVQSLTALYLILQHLTVCRKACALYLGASLGSHFTCNGNSEFKGKLQDLNVSGYALLDAQY